MFPNYPLPLIVLLLTHALALDVAGSAAFTLQLSKRRVDLAPWPYTSTHAPIRRDREDRVAARLVIPGEYCSGDRLSDKRLLEIIDECQAPLKSSSTSQLNEHSYMQIHQALSLRKQLLVAKISSNSWRLQRDMPKVLANYMRGRPIEETALDLDQPAIALMRALLTIRAQDNFPELEFKDIKRMVRAALRNEESNGEPHPLLVKNDVKQLEQAKLQDQLSFQEENIAERDTSMAWEQTLYDYLDSVGVKYMTEEGLKEAGCKSTPDVVLLDDLYINGRLVRWIDCKCYYGSAKSKHFLSSLEKQVTRYNDAFGGKGAIVYRNGFSNELQGKVKLCTLLDRGLLSVDDGDVVGLG